MQGGSGIGLAIVKEYAKLMQGDITVESELQKGSEFTLTLPLHEVDVPVGPASTVYALADEETDHDEGLATPLSHPAISITDQPYTILIVEDHPQMQQFIRDLLPASFRKLVANNGLNALEVLKTEPVDLIISDVMMPQMDGFALVEHLKASAAYFRIPIILLTALGGEAQKLKGLMLGGEMGVLLSGEWPFWSPRWPFLKREV